MRKSINGYGDTYVYTDQRYFAVATWVNYSKRRVEVSIR